MRLSLPALAASALLTSCGGSAAEEEPARARRVIMLVCDTLRADRLGAYGCDRGLTPNLDALAMDSVVFQEAYSTAPMTQPSVSSLMSGLLPQDIGVTKANVSLMPAQVETIAEVISAAGIPTAAVVSNWVLRQPDAEYGDVGVQQGFQHFDDQMTAKERNREFLERDAPGTTDAAVAWLEQQLERPDGDRFFLWVHYQDPHGPYTPPAEFAERFQRPSPDGETLEVGDDVSGFRQIPSYQILEGSTDSSEYRDLYDAEIAYFDRHLGRLLDWLKQHDLWDDSLILFTSDHGESLGDHEYWFCHGENVFREQVRVPLMARFPGGDVGDRSRDGDGIVRCPDVAGHLDVFPTIAEALGVEGGPTPGTSLWNDSLPRDRVFYQSLWRRGSAPKAWAISDGRFRVVGERSRGARPSLYDIRDDPGEQNDIASDHPALVENMIDRFEASRRSWSRARVEPVDVELSETELEAMRALGYIDDGEPDPPDHEGLDPGAAIDR